MRLIDADALKELFPDKGEGSWTYNITARMYIDNAPTVELTASFMRQQAEDELIRIRAEADQRGYQRGYNWGLETGQNLKRPLGKWEQSFEHRGRLYHKCSNCHFTSQIPTAMGELMYKYCPNCGAKMKGAEE